MAEMLHLASHDDRQKAWKNSYSPVKNQSEQLEVDETSPELNEGPDASISQSRLKKTRHG